MLPSQKRLNQRLTIRMWLKWNNQHGKVLESMNRSTIGGLLEDVLPSQLGVERNKNQRFASKEKTIQT